MEIAYSPIFSAFPPLTRVQPIIPDEHRSLAHQSPPPALPLHCKPWLDASSYGLLLRFPYKATLTVTDRGSDPPAVEMHPAASRRVYGNVATCFAGGHFGLATGYSLFTPPGIGIFTNYLPSGFATKATLVTGLVQTWWYPKALFVVFRTPDQGQTIIFEYGDPLCVLMPVSCEDVSARLMTPEELAAQAQNLREWNDDLRDEARWTSQEGFHFTHLYRRTAARKRRSIDTRSRSTPHEITSDD